MHLVSLTHSVLAPYMHSKCKSTIYSFQQSQHIHRTCHSTFTLIEIAFKQYGQASGMGDSCFFFTCCFYFTEIQTLFSRPLSVPHRHDVLIYHINNCFSLYPMRIMFQNDWKYAVCRLPCAYFKSPINGFVFNLIYL